MNLQTILESDLRLERDAIAADRELSQEIQTLLIQFNLLTPPPESGFGDRANASLERFQRRTDCQEPGFLGKRTATLLIEAAQSGTRDGADAITLEVVETTVLKLRPLSSSTLAASEKRTLQVGEKLDLIYFDLERKHFRIVLNQAIAAQSIWYVYADHVKVYGGEPPILPPEPDEQPPFPPEPKPTTSVRLAVPYKSQANNRIEPWRTCNVTSIAMCLEYLKVPRKRSSGQLEDELTDYMLDRGWSRYEGRDLARLVEAYGAKDYFTVNAKPEEVKKWLAEGNPAVFHGYFTQGGKGGHIIAVVGYDETGFIVHDPAGEYFDTGYDYNELGGNDKKGEFLHYSYGLIKNTCADDGQFFVHFISK
jgi:Peptidase_C39 like family